MMRTHDVHHHSPISSVMYLIAAIVFLLTAILGDTGATTAFLILSMVFLILALNGWRSP